MQSSPPVLGRESTAAFSEPTLPSAGDAGSSSLRAEGGSTPDWVVRAASVAGVRHRLAGEPCEDSFAWSHSEGVVCLAVADGVGSIEGSEGAARRAARAGVDAARREAGRHRDALAGAVAAANEAAEGGGATTLVLAVLRADGPVELARVGDSTAFVVSPGGRWREVFEDPDEDRVGGETDALPCASPSPERAVCQLAAGEVLVLATDGLADPWRDGPTTVAPHLASALAAGPPALELARLAGFSRHGCHDDRTVVCAWALGGPPAQAPSRPEDGPP